jgi:dihydroorotate dehydrogenase electron transfer subunit
MEIIRIAKIKAETKKVKTFRFKFERKVLPGQFFMVWLPSIDEIPMSVSYLGNLKGITVEKVGRATTEFHKLREGARIGIRGPYGNGYKLFGRKILFIAGGTGIISLAPAIELAKGSKVVILGARTKNDLLFLARIKRAKAKLLVSTDDGSYGSKTLASELAEKLLKNEKFDLILTCGPELMLKKVLEIGLEFNITVQASLERYMKCGLGICDSCAINGLHVCKDGPVFDTKILTKLEEFGVWKRNSSGRKIKI